MAECGLPKAKTGVRFSLPAHRHANYVHRHIVLRQGNKHGTLWNMHEKTLDILAFGPHPDDVEFGCGGFVAKAAKKGKRVGIIDLSLGEMATNGTVEERKKEAETAAAILGAVHRENLSLPDTIHYNPKEAQEKIVRSIRTYRPNTILIPYGYDRHPVHETGSRMVREAVFTSGLVKYKTGELLPHRPKHFYYYFLWCSIEPSFVLDISDVYETKIKALRAHESQFSKREGTVQTIDTMLNSNDMFGIESRRYGYAIQTEHAEPYKSVYFTLGVSDPDVFLPNLF